MSDIKESDVLPKQTIIGDKVRIRQEDLALYRPLYPRLTTDDVFLIIGKRDVNGRRSWRVAGDGPSELFSGHVKRAWGSMGERLEGLRAAGWKP